MLLASTHIRPEHVYYVLGILGLLIGIWFVLLVVTALLERRMAWAYGELQDRPHYEDPTGYGGRRVVEAVECGFSLLGWAPDLKGRIYRLTYAVLISPGRDCFAVIGIGSLLNMQLQGTWLHTPAGDGRRSFCSTDNQTCVDIDVSRNWMTQLTFVKTFGELWQKHKDWIQEKGVIPHYFQSGREIEEFRAFREEHYRMMSRLGLITYTSPAETHWRYRLIGAVKWAALSYSIGLLRRISRGRFPKTA